MTARHNRYWFVLLCATIWLTGNGLSQSHVNPVSPIAVLPLEKLSPVSNGKVTWAALTFISERTIAVGVCYADLTTECSLSVVEWGQQGLQLIATTRDFAPGSRVHPGPEESILVTSNRNPASLYSRDLLKPYRLDITLAQTWLLSGTGQYAGESANGVWRVYKLSSRGADLFLTGKGRLQAISDSFAVVQLGKSLQIEGFNGHRVGSFPAPGDLASLGSLGSSSIYLDNCKRVEIVGLDGTRRLTLAPNKGCSVGDLSASLDGSRMLVDFASHVSEGVRQGIDAMQRAVTAGMGGPEDVNQERIQVYDTRNGSLCFDWSTRFVSRYVQIRSGAMAPSGGYVAIVTDKGLSLFAVPAACKTN